LFIPNRGSEQDTDFDSFFSPTLLSRNALPLKAQKKNDLRGAFKEGKGVSTNFLLAAYF
jgi:hypothetical protein